MKMTVIGAGYVGMSTALSFAHAGHETILLECDPERLLTLQAGRCPFYEPQAQEWFSELLRSKMISVTSSPAQAIPFGDIIWIAVNTPAQPNGLFDLRALEGAIDDIVKYGAHDMVVVVKSTVSAGTCRRLLRRVQHKCTTSKISLVFNPEFLREGHAIRDFMEPSRVILGTENGETPRLVNEAYRSLEIQDARIISTTFENAEVIKQASNSFLAVKLTYINELANYCRCVSADIHTVAHCMGLDERIAPGYMESGIGFGGACLPKDTGALAADATQKGTPLTVLEQAISA
ncbi:MAG: UDP-glucose/GDP-mannose dehydrogenase family protein, partial [Oscillospiraceae bacterium]|nr:UDP-glucose/GDP-mannose dehydrogenase family protein [Oscillospiraceae bacterium]